MKNNIVFSLAFLFLSAFCFAQEIPFGSKLTLTQLNGKTIETSSVFLTINKQDLSIVGKSGCNSFNMNFTVNNNKCIKTGDAAGTLMACNEAAMQLESEFLSTLQNRKFKVRTKENKVIFKNWWGKTIMTFEKQSTEGVWKFIASNNWKLIQLNNIGKDYKNASITFDLNQNRVSGNAGCNNFFGSFEINADYINFSQMGSTKMACMDEEANQTETQFLGILSNQKLRYDLADQTLNFYDGNRLVMMFGLVR